MHSGKTCGCDGLTARSESAILGNNLYSHCLIKCSFSDTRPLCWLLVGEQQEDASDRANWSTCRFINAISNHQSAHVIDEINVGLVTILASCDSLTSAQIKAA